jgi:hypothetical protein
LVCRTFIVDIAVAVAVANYVLSPARIEAQKKCCPYDDFIIALYLDLQKRLP